MACHEIAALRLGLMRVLGRTDEAERQHELAELGGPRRGRDPSDAVRGHRTSRAASAPTPPPSDLEQGSRRPRPTTPSCPIYRTLVVLTKKVELDLAHQLAGLTKFYRELDTMHDFVHETTRRTSGPTAWPSRDRPRRRPQALGPDTRLVELVPDEPLGFTGGQYIIVDSGLVRPAARPSSAPIRSSPRRRNRAVSRSPSNSPGGPGSALIHALEAGARLRFSGPWGRFFPRTA